MYTTKAITIHITQNKMADGGRKKQQHVVLVHGACHGAWSWFKVATMLRAAGHRVTALDMAASGIDSRRIEQVPTFADYSQPLLDRMASLLPGEQVVLVGHSLGGLSVALAAERFPEKVAAVVFVAAFMPDCTSSPAHALGPLLQAPETMWLDTEFTLIGSSEGNDRNQPPVTSMFFGPDFLAFKLYQLCSQEELTLARALVRPSSLYAEDLGRTPAFSAERYGSVPSFYVVCSEDAAIVKEYQRWMIENRAVNCAVKKVFEIEGADHMVMFSKPNELYECLLQISAMCDNNY